MPIPAPPRFTDLKVHLHSAGVDAARLNFVLEHYLDLPANKPLEAWYLEPHEEHQAWAFREAIQTFQQMIVDDPEAGNGEVDPD
ncbi:hypothetical protein [Spirosoma sp.]|uniref:hypothetical protein n=1 Tax=Spirosoma sp. TaxID=1899569 RepID=UPI00262A7655|nr:hypothetical protein [Spirosoma sp.]MCX6216387.1 hypothetical protein [Spirosoma sp.]